ncbi:hypothetical protein PUMCH_001616 [Australozyma saopauloensis]|uniref:Uncharacterized protein n=1 Tax=Australozyma saopauloensis TaxID=291208 RepID=A0AAX4H781_9ASCO|nr:hypothetical protein PUMCH_001616 [[Candida] saopauloensis]
MYFFVSSQNLPMGYEAPPFPSLFWPAGAFTSRFQSAYLYYSSDMWTFTVWWSMIFFGSAYFMAGVWSGLTMFVQSYRQVRVGARKRTLGWRPFFIVPTYFVIGSIQGLLSGALVGLILMLIYKAGSLAMSTWIPFCWGMASILYHICSSYSTSLSIM